jgi:hypothetical protein
MTAGVLRKVLVTIVSSIVCAGVFYWLWMAVFLVTFRSCGPVLRGLLWMTAPVVTASGFAVGCWFWEQSDGHGHNFLRVLAWPLVACSIGAGAVYWYGPMLIVFGMFAAGTASVVLREVVAARSKGGHGP